MTDKRPSSTKLRRECFDANKREDDSGRVYMICHICNGPIWPSKGDAWEASHLTAHYFGGESTKPAHYKCHREQTAKTDIPAIAKSKRVSDKHFGITRKRAMPCGRNSKFKKKMDGSVVPR